MKRPGKTKKQRQYDREQRALLRLRRAAVRLRRAAVHWSECEDHEEEKLADLQAACDAYTTALGNADRRLLK